MRLEERRVGKGELLYRYDADVEPDCHRSSPLQPLMYVPYWPQCCACFCVKTVLTFRCDCRDQFSLSGYCCTTMMPMWTPTAIDHHHFNRSCMYRIGHSVVRVSA